MRVPTSIRVIGLIGVVWGVAAMLLGLVGGVAMLVAHEWLASIAREMLSERYLQALENADFRRTGAVVLWIQAGIATVLLVGSAQLLRLKPIGWRLMMIYAVLAIAWAVVDRLVLDTAVYARYRQSLNLPSRERPAPRLLPGYLFPIFAFYFLTRPKIAERYGQDWLVRGD
ncbi:MAG: hypothetical protein P3X24_009620 [bacterium]|nr:hypothetical protein [bacterium]